MPLSLPQIQEILSKGTNQDPGKSKASLQEERLRLHTETVLSERDVSSALSDFLLFVRQLLRKDKYRMFKTLMRFPLPTVSLVERIYVCLEKIFDGRNPVYKADFKSEQHKQDWLKYRSEKLDIPNVWKTEGFDTMKTEINSVMIVDLPQEQGDTRPEPYFYFLPIKKVLKEQYLPGTDTFEWIMFEQPGDKLAVFCDQYYRVYNVEEGTKVKTIGPPVVDVEHNLGYCPARFFWTTPANKQTPTVKKSPLSNWLGKLDLLLFWMIGNEHLNLYARWPIYWAFATDCDYEAKETGNYCDKGFLRDSEGYYLRSEENIAVPCPRCSQQNLDGPGTYVKVPIPGPDNGETDLRNPVGVVSIDTESLDYNNLDIEARKQEVFSGVTGYQGMSINDKAVNEKQVLAIFESLESSLKNPQMNFEQAMKWIDQTCCLLRYGSESFVSCSISLGTEHYVLTSSMLLEIYSYAKKSGFSTVILDLLEDLYFETEYRNNQEQLQRFNIIKNIEPFRHLTNSDVATMFDKNRISRRDYLLKVNLSSLILQFERKYGSLTEYGLNSEFDFRIDSIKKEIYSFIEESYQEPKPEPAPGEPAPGEGQGQPSN